MIKIISVDDIKEHAVAHKLNKADLQKTKNIITRFGQFKLILVNETPTGYEIIAGRLVYKACKEVGIPFINCFVFDNLTRAEIESIYLVQNSPKGVDVIENARRIEAMEDPREIGRLSNILPYSRKELQNFIDLKDFNWADFDNDFKYFQTSLFD